MRRRELITLIGAAATCPEIARLAEALGRHPPASYYSTDMSKHCIFGQTEGLREQNLKHARRG